DQEIFTMEQLIEKFSLDRISKAGAKFDYEKAKWYNHEWIKQADAAALAPEVKAALASAGVEVQDDENLNTVIELVKDRCSLISDFVTQSSYFFVSPKDYDVAAVKPKWNA